MGRCERIALWGLILLYSVCLIAGWTYTLDCDSPLGTDAPSTIDDKIRETRDGYQERLNVDHYFALTGSALSDSAIGQHRQIEFYSPITTPSEAANKSWLYSKDVSSKTELHWLDEDGDELQLTDGGTLNIESADLLGTLANETYFTAVNAAGDGTVNLIKANSSDVAVLPDGSETATSTAPTSDADIANKKYVDDHTTMVPAVTGAGTGFAGEESITFPNGLIMKWGYQALGGSASGTVTFDTAFPTGAHTVVHGPVRSEAHSGGITFSSLGTTSFKWYANNTDFAGFYWIATGR